MNASPERLRGSCLCGAVTFEVTTPIASMGHCHCGMCRRAHGSAYSTYCETAAAGLRILSGQDHIVRYASSAEGERRFCGTCGSKLSFHSHARPDRVWIAAGAFDDDPGVRAGYHIFVGSKAPWYDFTDDLPRHAAYPQPSSNG